MTIKTSHGYIPAQAIVEVFLKTSDERNMIPVFMSGVTGEDNDKKFVGITEKESKGQKHYYIVTIEVIHKAVGAMAVAGNVDDIPRTFPEAMALLAGIINGENPLKNDGNAMQNPELTKPNEAVKGFTSISEEENIRFMQSLAFQGFSLLFAARKWNKGSFTNQYVGLAKKLDGKSDNVYLVNIDSEQSSVGTQAMDLPIALFRMAEEISK